MKSGKKKKIKNTTPAIDLKNIRPQGTGFRVEVMVRGKKESGTAATLDEALLLRGRLRAGLKTIADTAVPPPSQSSGWTLEEGIEKTFKLHWNGTADEGKQRIRCRHLLEFFGSRCPLVDISPERIVDFREWAGDVRRNCPNTINKKVMALSRIMRTALEMNKLRAIPRMHMARIKNGRIRVFSKKEEEQIAEGFKHLVSQEHYEAFVVLIDTGFRLGELWTLTASSVNVLAGIVTLQADDTKNNVGRSVPMTGRVREILVRRAQKHMDGPLWPEGTNNWFQHQWNKVRASLGKETDPEWVAHTCRHTYITRMIILTGDPFLVQKLAGHKTLAMTQRYTHHAPQHIAAAGEKLDAYTKTTVEGKQVTAKAG